MIAIIPARGGSVRLPRKNIKVFKGQPLICYSIEAAHESFVFDLIVVSTDDDEIAQVAERAGAKVFRRAFDDGSRGTQDVAREVLQHKSIAKLGAGTACVIYPTCPLLAPADLIDAYAHFKSGIAKFAMSVQAEPLADAGTFYFGTVDAFLNQEPLISPHTMMIPIPRVCDINTQHDFEVAELMWEEWKREHN